MTPIHILAGLVALLAGAVALLAAKGSNVHRKAGFAFVGAMLAMAATGAVMAVLKPDSLSVIAGSLTLYLVTTAVLTFRQSQPFARSVNWIAMLVALGVAAAAIQFGVQAATSSLGTLHGNPPPPYFVFGSIALLGALLDARTIFGSGPVGKHRVARHLWRMCCAMLIATMSFFLGQAQVFPEAVRSLPLLLAPVLVVLLLWAYWLVRVLRGRLRSDA